MINKGLFTSKTEEWSTPQAFFDELNKEFSFTLDPCATKENAKCEKYFTKEDNGLDKSWDGENVFCNPPYGRQIGKWVKKAWTNCYGDNTDKGTEYRQDWVRVMLIPARTDTKWFHDYIYGKAEIRFIKGRLKFGDSKNSAPFPSMIVIFKP